MQTPTETLKRSLYRRSYRNIGDYSQKHKCLYRIFRVEDMLISLTQAETFRHGTLEKEKDKIMRYHNGPIEV